MRNEIILIGPMGIGKSHISELLSEKLGIPHIKFDVLRYDYYNEIGYSKEIEMKFREENKLMSGLYLYWKPFELHALKRITSQYSDCIFDLGAGHSVYDDVFLFKEAKKTLSEFKNVILLLPSENQDESLEFLKERLSWRKGELDISDILMLKYFMNHRSNYELCTNIVYVKGKSEQEIVNEIVNITGHELA